MKNEKNENPALIKMAVNSSTYYITQNILKTKKVKLKLPLYACVVGEKEKTYCKITDNFINILETDIYDITFKFSRINRKKEYPIAEVWFNNQISEKDFEEVLNYSKRELALV